MDNNILIEYAPIIIVVLAFCFKNQIFVTPAQLKDAKAEILDKVNTQLEERFATKEVIKDIKDDIKRLEDKIDNLQMIILEKLNSKI